MKTLIACGQFTPAPGDVDANISIIQKQATEAAEGGAGIIVFPELCLSGYLSPDRFRALAISADGSEMGRLAAIARETAISVCFGFPEKAPESKLFNSMAFVDAKDGLKAVYRKVHLWASELQWADPGEGFSTFEAGPVRMGMWICYDTRFPEAARSLAMGGATAALVGAAWVGPADEWELVLRARAIDNGMFVAGTVLQGENDGLCFHGTGIIVDPHGRVLARAAEGSDEVILGEYDPGVIRAFRDRLPLLEHRRPAAYRQS